jgi:hypothetical protein
MTPTAWLTALTAVIAAWIAYQQYRTARHRLRLDLFERRLAVYDSAITLIQSAVRDGNLQTDNVFTFVRDTRQAEFLFDQPVLAYIDALRSKSFRFRQLNEQLHEQRVPVGPERTKIVNEESELLNWYLAQAQGEASKQFAPYLSFRDVK